MSQSYRVEVEIEAEVDISSGVEVELRLNKGNVIQRIEICPLV